MTSQVLIPATNGRKRSTTLDLLTDGQLLERFTTRGDQTAFARLVERHGPLVLSVCRRILRHAEDAEDAFQAAFLVLARKAGSIAKYDSVASWLYKVAYRIAVRARAGKSRRLDLEKRALRPGMPPALVDAACRELGRVIDEEVQKLPEKYRAAILLCYLQGQTNEEAARQLRWPTGTVKIRLLRARELLRKRLVRRGLDLSAAVLTVMLLESSVLALPPALAATTVAAAAAGASSVAITGLVSASLKKMCLTKLKVALAVLLTVLVVTLADGLARGDAAPPDAPPAKERKPDTSPPSSPWSPSFGSDVVLDHRARFAGSRSGEPSRTPRAARLAAPTTCWRTGTAISVVAAASY
jgi:RNA polymerase sigma factor (sigma-70 family)